MTVKFVIRSQPFWPVWNGRDIVFRTNDELFGTACILHWPGKWGVSMTIHHSIPGL